MTLERREELLAKINQIACNNATVFLSTEADIKVTKKSESSEIVIDIVAHFMRTDKDRPDNISVSYAAAICDIENATL